MFIRAYGSSFNEFQPFKAPGPDGLSPVLLQKSWNQLKGYYHVIFLACLRHSSVPSAWKVGTDIFLPKPGKKSYFEAKSFRMISLTTLTSFQLKWLERLILYHIDEDNNQFNKQPVQRAGKVFCIAVRISRRYFYGNCFAWICAPRIALTY